MNLNNFELEIEPKIMQRGRSYFADGLVDELWRDETGGYHAVVDGSEPYEVEIALDRNGEIIGHTCDCPYEWGEFCKHEAAVLLAILEHKRAGTTLPGQRQKKKRGLAAQLEKRTKTELIGLIIYLSREFTLREDIECYFDEGERGE